MFSSIFINMNKSATLKLDKFIQLVLIEQVLPNYKLPNRLPAGALDVINDPNIKYADNLKKADYASIVPPKIIPKTPILIDKEIAQTIYDGKGTLWDNEATVIKVMEKIKNSKQYENVKAQFKLISKGQDMVTYIRSFTTIMDRLTMVSVLKGKISIPTLKTIVTYGDYKTAMLKSPSLANRFKIGTATAVASNMLTAITMNPSVWYAAQKTADDSSNTLADFWHEFSGEYDSWMETHSTWDTFINGANGKQDGIRSEVYTTTGFVTTTITSMIPGPSRVLTSIFFALLATDDIIRLSRGGTNNEVWGDLLWDLVGVFAGGASTIGKSAFKSIGQLLAKFRSGVKGKALIPFIEAVQRVAGRFASTKFGQLLKKLGAGIGTTISSMIDKFTSSLVSMLNSIAKKFPKLLSFCKRIINIISNISVAIRMELDIIWKDLKVLWQIISFPGKSASWIAQKLTSGSVVVKGAFGTGAKVYVNLQGANYIIMPEIEKLLNPAVEDAEAKMIVAAEAALSGAILGLPKTGNTIFCYTKDASGNLNYEFSYEMFYVPVDIADSTNDTQPVPIMMHKDTKDGIWMEIDITTDINAYNNGALFNATYWADSRELIQINKVPVTKYITKNNKK
jgi:hypothetical protein